MKTIDDTKELKAKCPNCNEKLNIRIQNNKLASIEIDSTFYFSEEEMKNVLKEHNIEFG